ncbi:MAG: hypothetical protein M3P39_08040, partial [Actinomycetota bacterium]|nr:hypothetical protein [Actinomycetota bacterium]
RFRTAFGYAFIVFGLLAAVLNSAATVVAARRGHWAIALGYLVITIAISSATLVGWYSARRQRPYRWRDGDEG